MAKERTVENPAAGSFEEVIIKAIEYAQTDDWDSYVTLCHPDFIGDSQRQKELKHYDWKRFTKWASSYFIEGKKKVKITKQEPEEIKASDEKVKVFLFSSKRDNPTPIVLKKHDGKWKIFSNSL
jgi:hypothetical protein